MNPPLSNPARPLLVHLYGRFHHPEFVAIPLWLRHSCCAVVIETATADRRPESEPDLILVALSFLDEFSPDLIGVLVHRAPLARLIVLSGAWSETLLRSRPGWPAGLVVPVWNAIPRLQRELATLGMCPVSGTETANGRRLPEATPWTVTRDAAWLADQSQPGQSRASVDHPRSQPHPFGQHPVEQHDLEPSPAEPTTIAVAGDNGCSHLDVTHPRLITPDARPLRLQLRIADPDLRTWLADFLTAPPLSAQIVPGTTHEGTIVSSTDPALLAPSTAAALSPVITLIELDPTADIQLRDRYPHLPNATIGLTAWPVPERIEAARDCGCAAIATLLNPQSILDAIHQLSRPPLP